MFVYHADLSNSENKVIDSWLEGNWCARESPRRDMCAILDASSVYRVWDTLLAYIRIITQNWNINFSLNNEVTIYWDILVVTNFHQIDCCSHETKYIYMQALQGIVRYQYYAVSKQTFSNCLRVSAIPSGAWPYFCSYSGKSVLLMKSNVSYFL